MKILGIVGSLRRTPTTRCSCGRRPSCCRPTRSSSCSRGSRDIPAFDEDLEDGPAPDAVTALKEAIAEADGVLVATPEYNGSIPGFLKNALDWVSRPFEDNPLRNKPAAVIGASTGMFGAVWAQADLRKVLGLIGRARARPRHPGRPGHDALRRGRAPPGPRGARGGRRDARRAGGDDPRPRGLPGRRGLARRARPRPPARTPD